MPEISESVVIRWDAEQPAQVARTLLASVNELDMALGKLGSQTAAAFASGMQTHLSSVREQVTGLRLEFERLGIAMGQTGRAPVGAAGFPSPITAPLGAAMPLRTSYWGDMPLPEGYTPGVGGGDRPFSPGFGGNWIAAGAGYFYNPSTGQYYRGIGGPFASQREVSAAIQGFQYGGRGQPGTLPVPPVPAPSLMDEEAQAAFLVDYNRERSGIRRFGRLFGEQAPEAYYGTPGWERQVGFGGGIEQMRAQAQAQQESLFGAMRAVGGQDYGQWRAGYQEDPFSGMRAQAQAEQSGLFGAMRAVGAQDYEAWRFQFQNMPIGQAIGAGYVAPARLPEAFAGGLGGVEQARWFEQQAYRMPGGAGAARAAVAGGLAPEEYEKLRRGGEAAYEAQEKLAGGMRKTGEETDLLTNRFTRHLTWIVQGIIIWESFRVVGEIIRGVTNEFIALESAAARVAYITGQAGARGAVLGQVAQGAQYGIAPGISEQGAILAAQTGTTPQQMDVARQMAFVFGTKEYSNALSELAQTQRVASAFGLEQVNVTGYLARAMKEVPVDQSRNAMEQYMDALQQGVTLYKDLGLTAEQSGLVVGRVAYAIEGSGTQAANVIQTIINNLRRPERREALAGFGITAEGIPEQLRQASTALQQLIAAGQDQKAQELVALLAGGTINVQRIREAPLVFAELANAIRESGGELGNWDTLIGAVGNTTERRIDRLTASWQAFLATFGQTGAVETFFSVLNIGIEKAVGLLQKPYEMRTTPQYQQFFQQPNVLDAISPALGAIARFMLGTPLPSQEEGSSGGPSQSDLLRGGRGGTGFAQQWAAIQARQNQPFGGAWNFQDLPKDVTFETLRTAIDKWDKILSQVSPEYTAKYGAPGGERMEQTLTYFRDPLTNIFDKSISSQEALRMALEELTKIERAKIIGVWNVPAGMDFMLPFAALLGNTGIPGGGADGGGGGGAGTGGAGGRGQPSVSAMQYLMAGRQGPPSPEEPGEISPREFARRYLQGMGRQIPPGEFAERYLQPRVPSRYERDEQFRRHNVDQMQTGNITINNRIIVQIDGKVVSTQLNRQLHMQNFGRNMVGGNPSSLLTE